MKYYVKIVMAGINIVCLLITLLYPNPATPFSLLPSIVTVTSWVFLTGNEFPEMRKRSASFLFAAVIMAAICIFVGTTSTITTNVNGGTSGYIITMHDEVAVLGGFSLSTITTNANNVNAGYIITIRDEVAVLGGLSFKYAYFCILSFAVIVYLIVCEVVTSKKLTQSSSASGKGASSFSDIVSKKINKEDH